MVTIKKERGEWHCIGRKKGLIFRENMFLIDSLPGFDRSRGQCKVRSGEWIEPFNDISFACEARGRGSLPAYARQTDRQVDSYEDRWMMQRLQHLGKWDQVSAAAAWTDPPPIPRLAFKESHSVSYGMWMLESRSAPSVNFSFHVFFF